MLLFLCADFFGQIDLLRRQTERLAGFLGSPDWVIHVGSLGAWPDPRRVDRATRRNNVTPDFIQYYAGASQLPFPTLFLPGKHEDHQWLQEMLHQRYLELVPNLHRLVNGYKRILSAKREELRVVGVGGVFSPARYSKQFANSEYYTEADVQRACGQGPVDLLLTTEAGRGAKFGTLESQALGLNNVAFATRPKLHVHAHYGVSRWYNNGATSTWTASLRRKEIVPILYQDGQFKSLT